jgi:3-hydroxyisobutyrate dehydrogenase-like beta-hydroxyacid dehydrogenase
VALGPDGIVAGLKRGGIYIDMSTIDPDSSRAVAAEFAKAGSTMLDARSWPSHRLAEASAARTPLVAQSA